MMNAGKQPYEFAAGGDFAAVLESRTALAEAVVLRAFENTLRPAFSEGLALLATGGFGRRELFPHSDVDLLLLVEKPFLAERRRAAISEFLRALWDAGLRVSHSVRSPSDCCELDERNVELSISLLDQRFLAGDRGLHARMLLRLGRFLHGERGRLAFHVCRLARARHASHDKSIYELEPDVKQSPGGLRDLQLVRWLGQLRRAEPERLPRPELPGELEPAREFLFALRCRLHSRAGRDCNLLSFDLQEEFAPEDPAGWMRRYFLHARAVHRAAVREMEAAETQASPLLLQFRDWRSRVANSEFSVSRERVFFRTPQLLEYDPLLVLRLFRFVARHGIPLALEAERKSAERLPALAAYFAVPRALWPDLREVLSLPHAALALRAMHETGVLGAIFPEWEHIECLVVRDFYHRYTVDEHTLRAIETLWDLPRRTDPSARPFAALFSEIDDPAVLGFALLFHDIGKAGGASPHVAESVRAAESAMERIGMPGPARRAARALIERHLDLSAMLNSRDIDDPATAALVAERAGTIEILKQLTLLTYCDISAVNPAAMTLWRSEQLWRLYLKGHDRLTRALESERIASGWAASPEKASFLDGFPVRYLRRHDDAEIEAHLELERRSRERGVAVDLRRHASGYRLTLIARDRPFLLASIAGALAGFGMNILKAEGFANRHGAVLDEFVFADPLRTLELNPPELDRLRLTLERVALGKTDAQSLLARRPRTVPPSRRARVQPSITFDSQASETATLIQIVAQDRPALLHDLARAISSAGCNIGVILIDTEAHKAIDAFYVTREGRKLSPADEARLSETLTAVCRPDVPPDSALGRSEMLA